MWQALVGQAMGGMMGGEGGGGGGGPAQSAANESQWNDRSYTNICPVGVNLGAILDPYNQGSTQNGGFGLELLSRFAPGQANNPNLSAELKGTMGGAMTWILLGGAALVAVFLLR